MSPSQKWIGIILAAFIVLFILLKLFPVSETPSEINTAGIAENYSNVSQVDVTTIIETEGCFTCHGDNFSGTDNAPALKNLSSKYSVDLLTSYLKNPVKTSKVEYPVEMPGITDLDDASVKLLAEYLLKL